MYARFAFLLLGRAIGLRRRHVVLFALSTAAALAALTVAFWWLGGLADAAIGLPGALAVAVAWAAAAALVLGGSILAAARILVRRVVRTLRAVAVSGGARLPRTSRS
jgi:hypothetical protein